MPELGFLCEWDIQRPLYGQGSLGMPCIRVLHVEDYPLAYISEAGRRSQMGIGFQPKAADMGKVTHVGKDCALLSGHDWYVASLCAVLLPVETWTTLTSSQSP